jgi:hypothetical protein
MDHIDISELSSAEYTKLMAEGLGDAEWADTPKGVRYRHYVDSLQDVAPPWDSDLLDRVQHALRNLPDDSDEWALGDDDDLPPDERAIRDEEAADDLIRRLQVAS